MAIPIWKRTEYSVSYLASPFTYSIEGAFKDASGNTVWETVFQGKAWAMPQEGTIDININNVARNYLDVDLPDLNTVTATTTYTHPDACRQFKIYNSASTLLHTYDFVWDWSFDEERTLSKPIDGHMGGNMFSLVTSQSGNVVSTTISRNPQAGYSSGYCGGYAIYYLNSEGGWDAYLLEGRIVKKDNFNRYSIENHKGRKTIYDNEITTEWELNTGWLNDRQSDIVAKNLISTDKIFLHNLITDVVTEVYITDTQVEYKTYKNEKQLISYRFNVQGAYKKKIY